MSTHGTVLAYHAIGSCASDPHNLFVPRDRFARQMAHLARRHNVVPLDELVSMSAPAGSIAITFDDAYVSVFEEALDILETHGFAASVFVPTAYIGRRNEWDPPSGCALDIAGADLLRSGAARGIGIESHGHDHIDMTACSTEAARSDLALSIDALRDIAGRRPRFLAYPFSTASPEVRRVAQESGFDAAFSIDRPHEGRFAYARVQVTPLDGPLLFAAKASGRYLRMRHSAAGRSLVRWTKNLRRGRDR